MKRNRGTLPFISKAVTLQKGHTEPITHNTLTPLVVIAITARVFYLIAIDYPAIKNAGWIAPLLGGVIAFPILFGARYLLKAHGYPLVNGIRYALGNRACNGILLIYSLMFMFEASFMFRILTSSAEYAVLYNMPTAVYLIPTGIMIILIATRGANGVGGAASIFLRILPAFYLLILLMEIPTSNIGWVFPLLGPGHRTILKGSLMCASYYAMIPAFTLLSSGECVCAYKRTKKAHPNSIIHLFLVSVFTSVFLLFIHAIVYPHIPSSQESRSLQLDLLLTNGKSTRAIQLPLLILWFSSLAVSNAAFLYASGSLFHLAVGINERAVTAVLGMIALILSIARVSMKSSAVFYAEYASIPFFGAITAAAAFSIFKRKRR